jgi:hypothetical protein
MKNHEKTAAADVVANTADLLESNLTTHSGRFSVSVLMDSGKEPKLTTCIDWGSMELIV